MKILYNISIGLYHLLIICFSPFNKKAKLWLKGRKRIFNDLEKKLNRKNKLFWFHAASLGEFEQGRPVIETLKRENPGCFVLLTFFSPSGYEIRKNYEGADIVMYLPFDYPWNVKKFLNIVKPDAAIFIKYEFWYNYISAIHNRNIPLILISAIFRKEQIFFKWYGGWFRKALSYYRYIFVQNNESKDLLKLIGLSDVIVSGDTRFDRVSEIKNDKTKNKLVACFKNGKTILIGGSTWDKDENLIIRFINESDNDIKYIIAPHEISGSHISEIIKKLRVDYIKYSEADGQNLNDYKVLIIDNIGLLSSLYRYAEISYIGGGFGAGLHNILEPATFGLPVIFGSNYSKFAEAKDLVEKGGAFTVNNFDEFEKIVSTFLSNKTKYNMASIICSNFVNENVGATNIILSKITNS